MNSHRYPLFSACLLVVLLVTTLPWLGENSFATGAMSSGGSPRLASAPSPLSGSAQITITTSGFDPAVLTVTVGMGCPSKFCLKLPHIGLGYGFHAWTSPFTPSRQFVKKDSFLFENGSRSVSAKL
jgi:hypothetical protein